MPRPPVVVDGVTSAIDGKILIIGAGGLGLPAAHSAAAGGVARLTLIDPDAVELSNLPRQVLFSDSDLGGSKAEVAAQRLEVEFPGLQVQAIVGRLETGNAIGLISAHDFVIDATDDPPSKFLINDACLAAGRPFVYGGVLGFQGQAMAVLPGRSACLRCLFEAAPPATEVASCREAGILGPVVGFIGSLQGREAANYLRGQPMELAGRVLTYDLRRGRARRLALAPRAGCRCGAAGGVDATVEAYQGKERS